MAKDLTNESSYREAERLIEEAYRSGAKHLVLDCLRIEELPESLGRLTQLESLDLSGCSWLKDLSGISKLTALHSLNLSGCDQLQDPNELGNLPALQSLDLSGHDQLQNLSGLENLTALQSLNLSGCVQLQDLSNLKNLTALQSLNLYGGQQLQNLNGLESLTALLSLDLSGCEQLQNLSGLGNLTALQSLSLYRCDQLQNLSGLENLTALQLLNLYGCQQLQNLNGLGNLTALQSLDLSECDQLQNLNGLENLTALQSLNLSGCVQLQDLSNLKNLTALQSLNLSGCHQLQNLNGLENLTALQSLDLPGCHQLQNLNGLENLTALQSLNLSGGDQLQNLNGLENLALQSLNLYRCEQLQNLSNLENLTALQSLNLYKCHQLQNLNGLENLTALQSLCLSECHQLHDLSGLENLSALQSLNLSGCDQLQDPNGLENLTALQSLNLSGCEQLQNLNGLENLTALQSLKLSWCYQLQNLNGLGNLTALQSLDLSGCYQLQNLSGLGNLTALQSLNLSGCCQLQNLSGLGNLTVLEFLNLSWCDQLQNLNGLGNLTALQSLNLSGLKPLTEQTRLNNLQMLSATEINNSTSIFIHPRLAQLSTSPSRQLLKLHNAPDELLQDLGRHDDALQYIIPWQKEIITSGAAPNSELKLFILGNGRVGKTQIARRLRGMDYNPEIPSTHGVELGRYRVLEAEKEHPEIHLTLWDFGGQDIYLGTHGLFLDERAIYVVAWHPEDENDREYFENGIPMRNRPLAYWLAYIRSLAGNDAPIIVVQTQCDEEDGECSTPLPLEHGFTTLKLTACSAMIDYGMERLEMEIRAAARLLRKRYSAAQIPQRWVDLEEELRTLRGEGEKTLSFDAFATLCANRHSLAHPKLIAGFLHRAGQVFWREGAFGNDLVLDQSWALKGIYTLLERSEIVPLISSNHGVFHPEQLRYRVWGDYTEQEQQLFLDMMVQCGACFPLGDGRYVAVELLPSERVVERKIESVWRDAEPAALVELHYDFLHDGVIKSTLSRIGEQAGEDGLYWRNGLCYYDRNARGAVLIRALWDEGQQTTQRGRIEVWVEGPQASATAKHLVESIESIRIGSPTEIVWRRGQSETETGDSENVRPAPFSQITPEAIPGAIKSEGGFELPSATGQQNILLFATEWESRHGGLSTFNRELCLALGLLGKNVCCVVPAASGEEITAAKKGNVQLITAPGGNLQRKLTLPEGFTPDIIIGHGRITGEAAKAQQADHYPNAKRIHFIHMAPGQIEWHKQKKDAAQQAEEREQQELALAKDATLVATVGPLLFRECSTLIERLPSPERPCVCEFIPGFKPIETRTKPASLHCLLVGRAEDETLKGIDIATQALQTIDWSGLPQQPELIIRGAPTGTGTQLHTNLRDRFKGVALRVREYASDVEAIAGDYRSAALTLMPSRCEGFGLVALESLSYGTPILISHKSGLAELLCAFLKTHEQENYIVETPDKLEDAANYWSDAIRFQLRDTEAAIRRADVLRKMLAERFTWTQACTQLLAELVRAG